MSFKIEIVIGSLLVLGSCSQGETTVDRRGQSGKVIKNGDQFDPMDQSKKTGENPTSGDSNPGDEEEEKELKEEADKQQKPDAREVDNQNEGASSEGDINKSSDVNQGATESGSQSKQPKLEVDYTPPLVFEKSALFDENSSPKEIMIVWGEDPAHEATITWTLDRLSKGASHTLYLSKASYQGKDLSKNYPIKIEASESGLRDLCGSEQASIRANVTGLSPNETYFLVATSGGKPSNEYHFVTAPSSDEVSFKLLSGGDSRTDHNKRQDMNRVISKIFGQDSSYLALIHGGDFVDSGKSCGQWKDWRSHYQLTNTKLGRLLPILPTFGNHESGGESQYKAFFHDPVGRGKFYFHSRIGKLDLLILNSEISTEGDQKSWLEERLKSIDSRAGDPLVIPSYHRPAWPAVKDPARTTSWIPLWERYKVALVLESDGHALKQTCPILNDQCSADGIIYVGEGGLGVKQRQTNADKWYFQNGGYAVGQHHVQSIEVAKDSASYQVFYNDKFHHRIQIGKPR